MGNDGFLRIAVTSPDEIKDEPERISNLLLSGEVELVHIRKPRWDKAKISRLIAEIPPHFHPRLKLHDHFELLKDFNLGGIHLNSRNPMPYPGAASVSISFHSIEQLDDAGHYDYVTLSPVFDSISKTGYTAAFGFGSLSRHIMGKNVVALGGVTPDKFPFLKEIGFYGAAMLGYYWNKI